MLKVWQSVKALLQTIMNRDSKTTTKPAKKHGTKQRLTQALLPWLGKLIPAFFGTATDTNLQRVKHALQRSNWSGCIISSTDLLYYTGTINEDLHVIFNETQETIHTNLITLYKQQSI